MNCPICTSEMIVSQATAFGSKYHYCKSCKKELAELGEAPKPVTTAQKSTALPLGKMNQELNVIFGIRPIGTESSRKVEISANATSDQIRAARNEPNSELVFLLDEEG